MEAGHREVGRQNDGAVAGRTSHLTSAETRAPQSCGSRPSISGPSATSKPMRVNSVSRRSSVRVTGCNPPGRYTRPGSVTSIFFRY